MHDCEATIDRIVDTEPITILYRSRSFLIEALRYASGTDPEEIDRFTREAMRRATQGTTKVPPLFDTDGLTAPERTYSALVAFIRLSSWDREHGQLVPDFSEKTMSRQRRDVIDEFLKELGECCKESGFSSKIDSAAASLRFALDQLGCARQGFRALVVPGDAIAERDGTPIGCEWRDGKPQFVDASTGKRIAKLPTRQERALVRWARHRDVNGAVRVVHDALIGTAAKAVLGDLPEGTVPAIRNVVAQTALAIDGSARRDALDALQRAGVAPQAARLFFAIIEQVHKVTEAPNGAEQTREHARLDWIIDQCLFCACHLGSLDVLDDVMREAGLDDDQPRNRTEHLARDPRRWVRIAALIGLAELSGSVNDQYADQRASQQRRLLDAVVPRIEALAREVHGVRAHERGQPPLRPLVVVPESDQGIRLIERSGEIRAFAHLLAMLRSEADSSVQMLMVLAGITSPQHIGAGTDELKAFLHEGLRLDPGDLSIRLSQSGTLDELGPFPDLITWQIAQWGLERIATRRKPRSDGVRLVDPLLAARRAEARMRSRVAELD